MYKMWQVLLGLCLKDNRNYNNKFSTSLLWLNMEFRFLSWLNRPTELFAFFAFCLFLFEGKYVHICSCFPLTAFNSTLDALEWFSDISVTGLCKLSLCCRHTFLSVFIRPLSFPWRSLRLNSVYLTRWSLLYFMWWLEPFPLRPSL